MAYNSTIDKATDDVLIYGNTAKDGSGTSYVPLLDTDGNLQVDVLTMPTITVNSHAVTNAGTFVVQENGAALTSLQLIDDSVVTLGTTTYTEATSKGLTIGAVRRDANTSLVDTTNEFTPLQVNATGELKVAQIQALPAGANAIGKLAANSGVDIGDVDITSIAAGDNNIGNVDIVTVPADPFGANADAASATGSISAKLRFIAATGIPVTGTVTVGSHAVTNAGTFAVQVDGAALTSLQLIDDVVYTDDTSTHSTGSSKGVGIMAAAAPTDTAVNANDIGMVGMTVNRELYVSLITALPAGSAAIGKLAANSGVDIGDVDITSINAFVAQDSPIAGNPLAIGGRASAAEPSAMSTDGDVVYPWFDKKGRQIVAMQAGTGTMTSVASSATSVTVLASNTSRKGATITNESTQVVYLKFGATASATSYAVVMAGASAAPYAYYEVPFGYTGIIDGIWASANGNARVTEIT